MISVRDLHFSYPVGEFELDVPQLVDGLNSLAHRIGLTEPAVLKALP